MGFQTQFCARLPNWLFWFWNSGLLKFIQLDRLMDFLKWYIQLDMLMFLISNGEVLEYMCSTWLVDHSDFEKVDFLNVYHKICRLMFWIRIGEILNMYNWIGWLFWLLNGVLLEVTFQKGFCRFINQQIYCSPDFQVYYYNILCLNPTLS